MALIRNVGRTAIQVGLILADGSKSSARIMPRGKGVNLPPGSKIDPNWKALYGQEIIEFNTELLDTKVVTESVPATGITASADTPVKTDVKEKKEG